MKRAVLGVAVAVGLVVGVALPTFALGLTQVTLSCDDGTSVTLVVDTDTLTSLTDSVQGMIDYPAGLTCTLVQSPVLISLGMVALASSGSNPFIVAGGRWQVPCSAFGLGVVPGLADGGTVARVPGAWFSLSQPTGSVSMQTTPEFVWVLMFAPVVGQPDQAFVTSHVTQTSGAPFPADGSASVATGDYLHFGFQDNGNPPGQNPTDSTPSTDMLAGPPATPEGTQVPPDCNSAEWPPIYHLGAFDGSKQYGNISVHQ